MKTCNGCKYLRLREGRRHKEWWCDYGEARKIENHEGDTAIIAPDWCPLKEVENV